MIRIFVVHNWEETRLAYLVPRLEDLALGLSAAGYPASVDLVGPDIDLIKRHWTRHNWVNRARRAYFAARMFCDGAMNDPRIEHREWLPRYFVHRFHELLMKYERSVRMEQEVYFAHTHARREAATTGEYALILESDAVLTDQTLPGMVALLNFVRQNRTERVYVDLAGGCDRKEILHSWSFEERYGCRNVEVVPGLVLHILPRFT